MMTDKERDYVAKLIKQALVSGGATISDLSLDEFAKECVSLLYTTYARNNNFTAINKSFTSSVGKLASKYKLEDYTKIIVQKSYVGLCNLLLASREYDADGATKVGKDNLSIYLTRK